MVRQYFMRLSKGREVVNLVPLLNQDHEAQQALNLRSIQAQAQRVDAAGQGLGQAFTRQ
jgi:hypothetical protein